MNSLQCKLARTALGWGVRDLAVEAEVSPDTIARLERGEELREPTVEKVRATLEAGGVILIAEDTAGGVGVRLAKRKPRARRK